MGHDCSEESRLLEALEWFRSTCWWPCSSLRRQQLHLVKAGLRNAQDSLVGPYLGRR